MAKFEKSFGRLAGALLIVAAAIFISCDGTARKAGGDTAGANEEYKVLGRGTVDENAGSDGKSVEKLLNDNARQGWKVRTAATFGGNYYIILAK